MFSFLFWVLPATVIGVMIGALLALLAYLPPLQRRWTKANRMVVLMGSAIVVFVIAFVLFAPLAAWAEYTMWLFSPYILERTCEDGHVTGERWLESNPSKVSKVKEVHERLKPIIFRETWLREMLPGPKCGPCYVLDEADCKLYIQYADANLGSLRFSLLLLAICASLAGGLVFGILTHSPSPEPS